MKLSEVETGSIVRGPSGLHARLSDRWLLLPADAVEVPAEPDDVAQDCQLLAGPGLSDGLCRGLLADDPNGILTRRGREALPDPAELLAKHFRRMSSDWMSVAQNMPQVAVRDVAMARAATFEFCAFALDDMEASVLQFSQAFAPAVEERQSPQELTVTDETMPEFNDVRHLANLLGVSTKKLLSCCTLSATAPFVRVVPDRFEELRAAVPGRVRSVTTTANVAATLLVLWFDVLGRECPTDVQVADVWTASGLSTHNTLLGLSQCPWLVCASGRVALNPDSAQLAIGFIKIYVQGRNE